MRHYTIPEAGTETHFDWSWFVRRVGVGVGGFNLWYGIVTGVDTGVDEGK